MFGSLFQNTRFTDLVRRFLAVSGRLRRRKSRFQNCFYNKGKPHEHGERRMDVDVGKAWPI